MNDRPCECGCSLYDHEYVTLSDGTITPVLYCCKCPKIDASRWCYNYRPCGNLEYLEWLNK